MTTLSVSAWKWAAVLSLVAIAGLPAYSENPSRHQHEHKHKEEEHAKTEWLSAGRDVQNTRSNPFEHRLDRENVSNLTPKWVFNTAGDVSATPTIEGKAVYVPDFGGYLYRINGKTGVAVWSRRISDYTGLSNSFSRNSPAIAGDLLVFGDQESATLMAVNKRTGALVWKTLLDSHPQAIVTNSPLVVGNRIFVGVASQEEGVAASDPTYKLSFRGSAEAVDLQSGSILWRFNTVPDGYTGGAVWGSTFAFDAKRNSLYVTTGNNYSVPSTVAACQKQIPDAQGQAACLAADDYIDAVVSLDPDSGRVKWARRLQGADTWIVSCLVNRGGVPCPDPAGPDYDFGSGANLFTIRIGWREQDVLGAGQKSGVYWALNPDDGSTLWATMVGPGGATGGIEWGSAADGARVYAAIENSTFTSYVLKPKNQQTVEGGSWAALDAATGKFIWQIAVPGTNPISGEPAGGLGAVTVANGVLYAGSLSGDMVAIDTDSGEILWQFQSGGSIGSGPAVVDGIVYWGSGYSHFGIGAPNHQLYAFSLPEKDDDERY